MVVRASAASASSLSQAKSAIVHSAFFWGDHKVGPLAGLRTRTWAPESSRGRHALRGRNAIAVFLPCPRNVVVEKLLNPGM